MHTDQSGSQKVTGAFDSARRDRSMGIRVSGIPSRARGKGQEVIGKGHIYVIETLLYGRLFLNEGTTYRRHGYVSEQSTSRIVLTRCQLLFD